jgi:hypothetical protein
VLTLEAVLYRQAPVLPSVRTADGLRVSSALGQLLGGEIEYAAQHVAPGDVSLNICVSTMIDLPFASGWLNWHDVTRAAATMTRHPPRNFTAAYECAGWGFALDYAHRRALPGSHIIITVADLNLLDLSFWYGDPNWGDSCLGISTVLFKVPGDGKFPLRAKVARSVHGMGEFCVDLRDWMTRSSAGCANVPFLPRDKAQIYGRLLDERRLLPNLNDRFGHCFGSDTWVSYVDHAMKGLIKPGAVYTATCASLRGYWAITDLCVANESRFEFRGSDQRPRREFLSS